MLFDPATDSAAARGTPGFGMIVLTLDVADDTDANKGATAPGSHSPPGASTESTMLLVYSKVTRVLSWCDMEMTAVASRSL